MARRPSFLERWPSGVILLLLVTAALLPLGLVLAWVARESIQDTNRAQVESADQQGTAATLAVESLISRNVLALRIAANGALASGAPDPCDAAVRSLSVSPDVGKLFRIRDASGRLLCSVGEFSIERTGQLVAPGEVLVWVSPQKTIQYRVGVVDGMATGALTVEEHRAATRMLGA